MAKKLPKIITNDEFELIEKIIRKIDLILIIVLSIGIGLILGIYVGKIEAIETLREAGVDKICELLLK